MELTTDQQTIAFLWAFLLGAIIELLYTVLCAVRVVSPPTRLQLFLGDVVFMLIVAILNTLYAISQTEGKVRLYVAAAEIAAYALLYFSVSRYAIRGLSFVIRVTADFFKRLFGIIRRRSMKIIRFINEKSGFKRYSEKN